MRNPFRYIDSSPEVIRLTVMMYLRYPLSLRQADDLLHERGVDITHETVRAWGNRFGPMSVAEIWKRRVHHRSYSPWRWHLDQVFVRINGETHYPWRAVDHEGEVFEFSATKRRDRRRHETNIERYDSATVWTEGTRAHALLIRQFLCDVDRAFVVAWGVIHAENCSLS